jgi:hypothetical protein
LHWRGDLTETRMVGSALCSGGRPALKEPWVRPGELDAAKEAWLRGAGTKTEVCRPDPMRRTGTTRKPWHQILLGRKIESNWNLVWGRRPAHEKKIHRCRTKAVTMKSNLRPPWLAAARRKRKRLENEKIAGGTSEPREPKFLERNWKQNQETKAQIWCKNIMPTLGMQKLIFLLKSTRLHLNHGGYHHPSLIWLLE